MKFNIREISNLFNVTKSIFIKNKDKFEDIINSSGYTFTKNEEHDNTIYEFEDQLQLKDDREICKELLCIIEESDDRCRYILDQTDIRTVSDIVIYIYENEGIINIDELANEIEDYFQSGICISASKAESIIIDLSKIGVIKNDDDITYFNSSGKLVEDELENYDGELNYCYRLEIEKDFLKKILTLQIYIQNLIMLYMHKYFIRNIILSCYIYNCNDSKYSKAQ